MHRDLVGQVVEPHQCVRQRRRTPEDEGSDPVRLELTLVGQERLSIVPLADENTAHLRSDWPHPSFGGEFLAVRRTVSAAGFEADWAVSSLVSSARAQLLQPATLILEDVDLIAEERTHQNTGTNVLLFELLTGRPPFDSPAQATMMHQIYHATPVAPSAPQEALLDTIAASLEA